MVVARKSTSVLGNGRRYKKHKSINYQTWITCTVLAPTNQCTHHLVIRFPRVICTRKRPWVIGECDSHLGGAELIIVGLLSTLVSWSHSYRVDTRGIAISSARVVVFPSIASCPDEDGAQAITTLQSLKIVVFKSSILSLSHSICISLCKMLQCTQWIYQEV